MSRHEVPHDPDDVYGSFVRELAASPERADLLGRMRLGHEPDEHGWCKHPGHAHHWERHPGWRRWWTGLTGLTGRTDKSSLPAAAP